MFGEKLCKLAPCFGEGKWNSRLTFENVSIASARGEVNLVYGTALIFYTSVSKFFNLDLQVCSLLTD